MPWVAVLGLIAGGVIVAPFAARLAGRLPQHVMGTMVGGLMLIVNGGAIGKAIGGIPVPVGISLAVAALAVITLVARRAYRYDLEERVRRQARDDQAPALEHLQ